MAKHERVWHTNKQQFRFKAGHESDMSTFVVHESINYFLENGNKIVFGCFLDLLKAYRITPPRRAGAPIRTFGTTVNFQNSAQPKNRPVGERSFENHSHLQPMGH